jgi:hypothetical protein
MIRMLTSLLGKRSWRTMPSKTCVLPRVPPEAPELLRQLLVLSGGLALAISRYPVGTARKHIPNSVELYEKLREELSKYGRTRATADLLLETWHECSHKLDPASKSALQYCLNIRTAAAKRSALDSQGAASASTTPADTASSLPQFTEQPAAALPVAGLAAKRPIDYDYSRGSIPSSAYEVIES